MEEPLFWVIEALNPVFDDFEIVGIYSKDEDADAAFTEEMQKAYRCGGVAKQKLPMHLIMDMMLRQAKDRAGHEIVAAKA